ncbi:MAG: hypothetical protein NDJ90_00260 [Oligoflexia bacterium]|nr:hypothetical protein [Oligoflexia bacterium]
MRTRTLALLALTSSALALVACNNEEAAKLTEARLSEVGVHVKIDPTLAPPMMELLANDFITLTRTQDQIARADSRAREIFSTHEGGTVLKYLNTRLRYFMPAASDEFLLQRCTLPRELRYSDFLGGEEEPSGMLTAAAKSEMGAANIGAAVWLLAVVNDLQVSCRIGDTEFPVDGTRAGLMMFGPGYKAAEKIIGPLKIKLPPEYRQAILVHEARHSDCPSGLTEDDIAVARASRNGSEFDRNYAGRQCGHLHKLCPAGHSLEGIAACDDVVYGAYYMGAVFSAAAASYLGDTDDGRSGIISKASIMSASAADSFGRLLVDAENGKLELGSTSEVRPAHGSRER